MQNQPPPDPREEIRALADRCAASRGGDREAFEALHARFAGVIRAFFARRLPGGAANTLADDLSQRVWSGLFDAFVAGRYDPARSAVTTFLYAIASKTWLRHLRTSARGPAVVSGIAGDGSYEDAEALHTSDDPASESAAAELLQAVRQCLADRGSGGSSLSDDEHAIILAAAAGASDRALAERFGLAPSTINAKKQSGWEKVRRYLARLGHRADSSERDAAAGEATRKG